MEQLAVLEDIGAHLGMPPCRGRQVSALRRYVVACRSSACVADRTGCGELAHRLRELADRVEFALDSELRSAVAALA